MTRHFCLVLLWVASFASVVPAIEPVTMQAAKENYRITLRNAAGQISLPDEPRKKTFFLDVSRVGQEPTQYFGGPDGERFKAVKFEIKRVPDPRTGERDVSELTIMEVVPKRMIVLVMGKEVNLADTP